MGSRNGGGFVADKGESPYSDCNHHQHHHNNNTDESGTKFAGFNGDQDTSFPCRSSGVSGGGIGNFGAMYGVGAAAAGGGGMTSVFTPSQREELERQKLFYRNMTASMAVPIQPLIYMSYPAQLQHSSNQHNEHGNSSGWSRFYQRCAPGSRDLEPWRCRRTDGKKWRCAKRVSPNEKYCEKHSRKGKSSRSRKHVESSPASPSSLSSNARKNNNNTFMQSSSSSAANITKPSLLLQPSQSMFISQHPQNPAESNHSRLPEFYMKRDADHHHHDQSTASPFFLSHVNEMDPFSRATHTSFMANNNHQSHSPTALPRQFLDEWSLGPKPDSIAVMTGKPMTDSSLLTLSMAGGSRFRSSNDEAAKLSEGYSWMGSSTPGGPLAEALCLGIAGADGGGSRGMHQGHGESGGSTSTNGPRYNKWFD